MKNYKHFLQVATIFIYALISMSYSTAQAQQTKHGLIIAIGSYPAETDWKPISSVNDIQLIRQALLRQGFSHIDSLKNEQATKSGILQSIETLINQVKPGDIVVLHISSHGQQIDDNNGDELDGYDEAIVAYGAPMYSDDGYSGEQHLRDEELGEILDRLREKLGKNGDLMVFLDACHSGTGTRGEEIARGGAAPIHVNNSIRNIREGEDHNALFESPVNTRGNGGPLAPMVVFSGASADERNFEYKGYGSLSVAISKCFDRLSKTTSYRAFWAEVLKEMSVIAPNQTPAAEGEMDRELFGGRVLQTPQFYLIETLNNQYMTLQGGKLNGLFKGTELAIFPAGTLDIKGKTPLTTAVINYAEFNFAGAGMQKALDGNPGSYWAFVTRQTLGDIKMKLRLKIEPVSLQNRIKLSLDSLGLVDWAGKDAEFELTGNENGLALTRVSDASVVLEGMSSTDDLTLLHQKITRFLQGKFIKDLKLYDPSIQVELILEPVLVVNRRVVDTLPQAGYMKDGMLHFKDGDQVRLKLVNKGSADAYITIVDIEPSGKMNVLVPNPRKGENPTDFKIAAGSTHIIDGKFVTIRKPSGLETFKVIASHSPLNLGPIIDSGGEMEHRGTEKAVESLFRNSYKASTRGGDMGELLPDAEANTSSVVFKIEE